MLACWSHESVDLTMPDVAIAGSISLDRYRHLRALWNTINIAGPLRILAWANYRDLKNQNYRDHQRPMWTIAAKCVPEYAAIALRRATRPNNFHNAAIVMMIFRIFRHHHSDVHDEFQMILKQAFKLE